MTSFGEDATGELYLLTVDAVQDGRAYRISRVPARFSNDNPRQEGVIGEHQALVWLPLKAGENEILLALTEIFGGRGLIGRLEPADGARLVFERSR